MAVSGEGTDEVATAAAVCGDKARCKVGDVIVKVDPRYFRPTEIETLLGDASKAKHKLGWTSATTLGELVREMVHSDYEAARRDTLIEQAGFASYAFHE